MSDREHSGLTNLSLDLQRSSRPLAPKGLVRRGFLDGLSQQITHTFVYTTNEPPLPITSVMLNVPCKNIKE